MSNRKKLQRSYGSEYIKIYYTTKVQNMRDKKSSFMDGYLAGYISASKNNGDSLVDVSKDELAQEYLLLIHKKATEKAGEMVK